MTLGGAPPAEVTGAAVYKLARRDNDVVSTGDVLEMTFPAGGEDRVLRIAARIESLSADKIPFRFPLEDLGRPMDGNARFYDYSLNSVRGGNAAGDPFFREYYRTGTGHPDGFTYGWVGNDDENLYVTIDFTPDNTMDGNEDYAAVYVKTTSGVKEFKLSVAGTGWGKPLFTYTDKVSYQHKVYEFKYHDQRDL